jgi:predicted metallo-beta-lactamase superfamily hydrolase
MSMFACEKEIMDLWDRGKSLEAISVMLGKSKQYVRQIVTRYHIDHYEDFTTDVRAASQTLAAAIQQAGLAA